MRPIFLIGYMCSGKTTLGRAIAASTGMEFIDLDTEVERQAGMTVKEIFATEGEESFRRREAQALRECADRSDVVVACGGGTPCHPGAMELMNSRGLTVRLVPSLDMLVVRLMHGRKKRPLLRDIESPEQMRQFAIEAQSKREAYYSQAQSTFDSTRLENPEQIADTSAIFIERYITPQR